MQQEDIIKLHVLHPAQKSILSECKRFNVLKCGRRFGKTDLAKELIINPMLDGFPVAYYAPIYDDVDKVWEELLTTLHQVIENKSVQSKSMKLITGGTLDMWSLENVDAGRGYAYKRVIIDEAEKAPKIQTAWERAIRGTLVDYRGDAWFMSTPKFGQTYFKATLFTNQHIFPEDWKSWRFTSYDNPHLPPGEIEEIKRTMSDKVFRCEYLAEDVDISGNRWAFSFNREKHLLTPFPQPKIDIFLDLAFDFNVNPICCSVIQYIENTIYVYETIALNDSNIHTLCDVIRVKYPNFAYRVTGDATGQKRDALVNDNSTYYTVIAHKLRLGPGAFRVPTVNPRLEDNQVLVNSILEHKKVQINPDKAQKLVYDLENVQTTPDGKIMKDNREDATQQADALDTFRYYCNTFHWNFLALNRN